VEEEESGETGRKVKAKKKVAVGRWSKDWGKG
jgi:hypothetical protein